MARKKKEEVIPAGVQEHDGVKIGDEVWCKRFPSGDLACGPVISICLDDSEPCFTFSDKFDGSFRMALFSSIIPIPTKAMWRKLDRTHARQNRSADRKEAKALAKKAKRSVPVRRK
tara:strand:+ start:89 stop:436 length:348 start_codon:yes stop_codon:yes gene_type:complete